MPVEQLRDLQLERMKKTVQHSYDNVAFYQRSFKEAGVEPGDLKTLEDLPKFPFVVKQDMRDAYPFGLFAVPQTDRPPWWGIPRTTSRTGATASRAASIW